MHVKILMDVYAYYEHKCPKYRFYVDDNLYNERDFWVDCFFYYISEEIHVEIDPGIHTITLEKVSVPDAKLWIEKIVLEYNNKITTLEFPVNPQNKHVIEFKIE